MTANQTLQEEFAKRMSQTGFEWEWIPNQKRFKAILHKAMMNTSLHGLRCHLATWENMLKFDRVFLMPEMQLCLALLKGVTPKDMNMTLEEHYKMLLEVIMPIETKFEEVYNYLLTEAQKKTDVKQSIVLPAGRGFA